MSPTPFSILSNPIALSLSLLSLWPSSLFSLVVSDFQLIGSRLFPPAPLPLPLPQQTTTTTKCQTRLNQLNKYGGEVRRNEMRSFSSLLFFFFFLSFFSLPQQQRRDNYV
jgi:hypothetical protein